MFFFNDVAVIVVSDSFEWGSMFFEWLLMHFNGVELFFILMVFSGFDGGF